MESQNPQNKTMTIPYRSEETNMHLSKHQSLLRQAYIVRPKLITDDSPALDKAIKTIESENPSAFWKEKDFEKRRFYHAPRPGTPYAAATHAWPKELL